MGGWGNEYIEQHWITSIVNLSFGAKKKEKKNNTQGLLEDVSTRNTKAKKKGIEYSESNKSKDCLIVKDCVIVVNHGMK